MESPSSVWFSEKSPLWPGQAKLLLDYLSILLSSFQLSGLTFTPVLSLVQAMTLEIEEKLEDFKSEFQHIQVFKTKTYGLMLVLDGAIQVSSFLLFIFHLLLFQLSSLNTGSLVHRA